LPASAIKFDAEIQPLVEMLETTPREKLLEEVAARIRRGLSYQELLTALLLAGVRNIQPRPVGHKFHAVLVVNSAHLASISSPDSDRWLPIFWALDYFKSSQAQNAREGGWSLPASDNLHIPSSARARQAFTEAMDAWDEGAADAAVVGLARTAGAQEIFEIMCRYGARDFRDIGHKAIYVANSWRTLQAIGWQHAEPVLRSLTLALLDRDGDPNPAKSDLEADRPWRANQAAAAKITPDWLDGKPDPSASLELLQALRHDSAEEASSRIVELLNRGLAPQSIWDAVFGAAAELLMRRPGILSLHAVTSTNALYFAFRTSSNDETRRLLLLQNAAFLPLFRGDAKQLKSYQLDELKPATKPGEKAPTIEEIFENVSHDRMKAAGQSLSWLKDNPDPQSFISAARRLVFLKGNNPHDYKFSSAVLEDYRAVSPAWRDRYLAASVFNLRGAGDTENSLVKRIRAAFSA
jgi:hypothetical protein